MQAHEGKGPEIPKNQKSRWTRGDGGGRINLWISRGKGSGEMVNTGKVHDEGTIPMEKGKELPTQEGVRI